MPEKADSPRTLSACAILSCAYFAAIGGFTPYAPPPYYVDNVVHQEYLLTRAQAR